MACYNCFVTTFIIFRVLFQNQKVDLLYLGKIIRSLRSLCLLKVLSDDVNYQVLPLGLLRDLNVITF